MNNKVAKAIVPTKKENQKRLYNFLLKESNTKLRKDVAMKISISVINSLDFNDPYVSHKSMCQRAKDLIPKIKNEYFIV